MTLSRRCHMATVPWEMQFVLSHPIPWDISHGIPMGTPFPWTSLGKDEGAFETKFTAFSKSVLITLQIKLRQNGGGPVPLCPPTPGYATACCAFTV